MLDQGKVLEQGTHEELLEKVNGHYASLWNSQRTHRKLKEEINVDGKEIEKYEKKTNEEPLQK